MVIWLADVKSALQADYLAGNDLLRDSFQSELSWQFSFRIILPWRANGAIRPRGYKTEAIVDKTPLLVYGLMRERYWKVNWSCSVPHRTPSHHSWGKGWEMKCRLASAFAHLLIGNCDITNLLLEVILQNFKWPVRLREWSCMIRVIASFSLETLVRPSST